MHKKYGVFQWECPKTGVKRLPLGVYHYVSPSPPPPYPIDLLYLAPTKPKFLPSLIRFQAKSEPLCWFGWVPSTPHPDHGPENDLKNMWCSTLRGGDFEVEVNFEFCILYILKSLFPALKWDLRTKIDRGIQILTWKRSKILVFFIISWMFSSKSKKANSRN